MQVLLNERLVGALRLAGSSAMSFTYDREWLAWGHAMPISLCSLCVKEGYKGELKSVNFYGCLIDRIKY